MYIISLADVTLSLRFAAHVAPATCCSLWIGSFARATFSLVDSELSSAVQFCRANFNIRMLVHFLVLHVAA